MRGIAEINTNFLLEELQKLLEKDGFVCKIDKDVLKKEIKQAKKRGEPVLVFEIKYSGLFKVFPKISLKISNQLSKEELIKAAKQLKKIIKCIYTKESKYSNVECINVKFLLYLDYGICSCFVAMKVYTDDFFL